MFKWFTKERTPDKVELSLRKRITEAELRLDDLESFQENVRNMSRRVQKRREILDVQEEDTSNAVLVPV